MFIGFFGLSIFTGVILFYFSQYVQKLPFFVDHFYLNYFLVMLLLFSFTISFISFLAITLSGIGYFLSSIGFSVGYDLIQNSDKLVKNGIWIVLIIGTIMAAFLSGIKGFIAGLVSNAVYSIYFNREKILKTVTAWKDNWLNKK